MRPLVECKKRGFRRSSLRDEMRSEPRIRKGPNKSKESNDSRSVEGWAEAPKRREFEVLVRIAPYTRAIRGDGVGQAGGHAV